MAHDHYEPVLRRAFPYVLDADADEIRSLAASLLEPREDFLAGGSSFAVVVIPRWRLYLSESSMERLGDPRARRLNQYD